MEAKNNNKNGFNVIENKENEVQVTEESRKAYGRPSVNEEKGWKLDHVIHFDFYHDAYIMSRKGIDELVNMVLQECNIKPDDTCSWAKDIRTIIKYCIEHYDQMLEEDEEDPDEENCIISEELVGDAIKLRHEAYYTSDLYVDHTFEEAKAYHTAAEGWEIFLAQMRMTEEEYKEYRDKIRNFAM